MSKETALESITKLVNQYQLQKNQYRNSNYNEERLKHDFIIPFFQALDWDIDNSRERALEAYREVVVEDRIKIGNTIKHPDYAFRLPGGQRFFFVEVKKPSVNVMESWDSAKQIRQYGWNAGLRISVLTNFEFFSIYDCTTEPNTTTSRRVLASESRIRCFGFDDYISQFDFFWDTFSRKAVIQGSFDRFVTSGDSRRGTMTIGDAFLEMLDDWRQKLADDMAKNNPQLTGDDLTACVQGLLNRLLFLRIVEDRGLEMPARLKNCLKSKKVTGVSTSFYSLCRLAETKYDSGLFDFQRDRYTSRLIVSNEVMSDLISGLYLPKCEYHFSLIPVEILGNTYEQFLGQVIEVTPERQVCIVEKPEVQKSGGVFYTPPFIVDYILDNTLEKMLQGRTPQQVEQIKIVDPACGSGIFLIGAYQRLLRWYFDYYRLNPPSPNHRKKSGGQVLTPHGELSASLKQRILLNNIYGVDIDHQAVEITKLSLLLKCLEGETQATVEQQMEFFHSAILPPLENNIRCGNSLVEFDCREFDMPHDDVLKPFAWETAYPSVFQKKQGGFDLVLGNPPWGADIDSIARYLAFKYPESTREYKNSYKCFIELGVRLLKNGGYLSYIVPSTLQFQPRTIDIRGFLLKDTSLKLFWNIGDGVFRNRKKTPTAPCCVFAVKKEKAAPGMTAQMLDTIHIKRNNERVAFVREPHYHLIPQTVFHERPDRGFIGYQRTIKSNEVPLERILELKDCGIKHQRVGVGLAEKGKSDLAERLYYEGKRKRKNDQPYFIGDDMDRDGWFVNLKTQRFFRTDYQSFLRENEIVYFNRKVFELPQKIVWRQTSDMIRAAIIEPHWFGNTLQAGIPLDTDYDLRYVLGLLNSRFLNYIYMNSVREGGRVFPQVKLSKVKLLPIRIIDFTDSHDVHKYQEVIRLVDEITQLYVKKHSHSLTATQNQIEEEIRYHSLRLNDRIYDLYNVSHHEIHAIDSFFVCE